MDRNLRRRFLALCGASPWLVGAARAQGDLGGYPRKPITIINPYTPSGMGDSFTRLLSKYLGDRLKQTIVVENRPGASQAIACETVAKSAPDGYTLMLGAQSGMVLNVLSKKKVPFDPVSDFAPISGLYTAPLFLVVNPSVPAKTMPELIALAKARPGKLTFASIGIGTSSHLAGEMLNSLAGVNIVHVPYKGGSPAFVDLLAGRVDMMFEGGVTALPYVRKGQLRALASTDLQRSTDTLPGLPTVNETLPGYQRVSWFSLFAPAGTPAPILDMLHREIVEVLKMRQMHEPYDGTGVTIEASSPDVVANRLKNDLVAYEKALREAGIQPE
jgi:tripartite-type tricarboxylate transporter receptor subunit TctC